MRRIEVDFGALLHYIETYTERDGIPPSLREIAPAFGISCRTIRRCLLELESAGRVKRLANQHQRCWVLPDYQAPTPTSCEPLPRKPYTPVDNRTKHARWLTAIEATYETMWL